MVDLTSDPKCDRCQTPMERYAVPGTGGKEQAWRLACPCQHSATPDGVRTSNVMTVEDHLRARIENQRLEIERLRGLKPELPPRAPDGEGLPRYGLRWNGPHEPMAVPMDDGFWTPWHLAAKAHGNETVEPPTREEALRRIEEACRSIEILCDHFGMDPAEFLADSRSEKASEPLPCEHLRSEWLGEKRYGSEPLFEMRKCLDCAKIFRVRKSVGKSEQP